MSPLTGAKMLILSGICQNDKTFLAPENVHVAYYPLYAPELCPCNIFLIISKAYEKDIWEKNESLEALLSALCTYLLQI